MSNFKSFTIASSYVIRGKTVSVSPDGIFEIRPTRKKINANSISFGGHHPYVARGEGGNGIRGYIDFDEKYLNPANTISFGQDTATLSFQAEPYFTGDKIQIFKLNKKYGTLTEKVALYLIATMKKAFSTFAWGQTSFALDAISYIEISLPVDGNGNLDIQYMQDRIAELEQNRIAELEQNRIAELDAYMKATGLDDCKLTDEDRKVLKYAPMFKEFQASELFQIKKGKRLTKANMVPGNINFIGSSSMNNGVTARIGNTEHLHPAHTITVSYNGSVGEVFLQDERFWASDDVNVWYPKFKFGNEIMMYFMTAIKKLSLKYSYTAKWTIDKMRVEWLNLPVVESSDPYHKYTAADIDFDYMGRYIHAIEKLTIADVVKYKDKEIAATKQIVNT